jgi:hypothetical protein
MNLYELVLGIVIVVVIASVIRTMARDNPRPRAASDLEAERLREEVRTLKDRLTVLERIATDKSVILDREIEELRER